MLTFVHQSSNKKGGTNKKKKETSKPQATKKRQLKFQLAMAAQGVVFDQEHLDKARQNSNLPLHSSNMKAEDSSKVPVTPPKKSNIANLPCTGQRQNSQKNKEQAEKKVIFQEQLQKQEKKVEVNKQRQFQKIEVHSRWEKEQERTLVKQEQSFQQEKKESQEPITQKKESQNIRQEDLSTNKNKKPMEIFSQIIRIQIEPGRENSSLRNSRVENTYNSSHRSVPSTQKNQEQKQQTRNRIELLKIFCCLLAVVIGAICAINCDKSLWQILGKVCGGGILFAIATKYLKDEYEKNNKRA